MYLSIYFVKKHITQLTFFHYYAGALDFNQNFMPDAPKHIDKPTRNFFPTI